MSAWAWAAGWGVASRRVTAGAALVLFAGCELGIAGYGALSRPLRTTSFMCATAGSTRSRCAAASMHFATLAVPRPHGDVAAPADARGGPSRGDRGATIAFLYGINVLGARHGRACHAVGLLPAPRGPPRRSGPPLSPTSSRERARWRWRCNARAGSARRRTRRREDQRRPPRPPAWQGRFGSWIALYALSGFCALALEMLWFRMMEVSIKSTSYTFGTLLALYLFGSGVGAIAGISLAPRIGAPRRAFLACQCALLVYACAAIALLAWMPPTVIGVFVAPRPVGRALVLQLGAARTSARCSGCTWCCPGRCSGSYAAHGPLVPDPPARGADDPAAERLEGRRAPGREHRGLRRGSLVVGLLTLTWLGTMGTFRLLALVGLAFAALVLREPGGRRLFRAGRAAGDRGRGRAVAAPALARLHGTEEQASLVEEDATRRGPGARPQRYRQVWEADAGTARRPSPGWTPRWAPSRGDPSRAARRWRSSASARGTWPCPPDAGGTWTSASRAFEPHALEHRLLSALALVTDAPPGLPVPEDPRFMFVSRTANAIDRDGALRPDRGGRAVADQPLRRQPVLGRVLPHVRGAFVPAAWSPTSAPPGACARPSCSCSARRRDSGRGTSRWAAPPHPDRPRGLERASSTRREHSRTWDGHAATVWADLERVQPARPGPPTPTAHQPGPLSATSSTCRTD